MLFLNQLERRLALTALGWLHLAYGLAFAILLPITLLKQSRFVSATIGSWPASTPLRNGHQ